MTKDMKTVLKIGLVLMTIAIISLIFAISASAQCTLGAGPTRIDPGPSLSMGWGIKPDYIKAYTSSGSKRLIVRATYGYTVYDITTPVNPVYLAAHDIHQNPNYKKHGDGQTTVNSIGVSDDGQRLLVGYNDTHGTLNMTPSGALFTFGGDFAPTWSGFGGGLVPVKYGTRYVAFAAPGTSSQFKLSDITVPLTGAAAQVAQTYPSEAFPTVPNVGINTLRHIVITTKQYLVYKALSSNSIIVMDVSNPGPTNQIGSGFTYQTFTEASLGVTGSFVFVQPININDKLYIFGAAAKTVFLAEVSMAGVVGTVQKFTIPAPYTGSGYAAIGTTATSGTYAFFWGVNASTVKLYTFNVASWGTDLTPSVSFSTADPLTSPGVEALTNYTTGNDIYLYTGNSGYAHMLKLTCTAPITYYCYTCTVPVS